MLLLVCLSDCVCLSLCYLFYCVTMGLYPIQINGMEWNGMVIYHAYANIHRDQFGYQIQCFAYLINMVGVPILKDELCDPDHAHLEVDFYL